MDILLVAKSRHKLISRHCSPVTLLAWTLVLVLATAAGAGWLGYRIAADRQQADLIREWDQELQSQRVALAELRERALADAAALTQRLGRLQGHVSRIDALGQRLVSVAELDQGEFAFEEPPAVGGPEAEGVARIQPVSEIEQLMTSLESQLAERDRKLAVLEKLMQERQLIDEIQPEGRPIEKGWMSSRFGMRNSPFNGRREMHEGVDFAGKKGSPVIAVAGGVVTWAASRYGYGNLVEINHGNGLVTRYGHNSELLVAEGDRVRKGQQIARMGSSGRSTGPHVHFEVIKQGRPVDPIKYIQASR